MQASTAALKDHCSIVHNNTLFTYGQTFNSIDLVADAVWTTRATNIPVTDPSCLVISDILWIVGGTTDASYSGIQTFDLLSNAWSNMTVKQTLVYNITGHSTAFVPNLHAILFYGRHPASSQSFLLDITDNSVTALPTGSPPPLDSPILVANASSALLFSPDKIYSFEDRAWKATGITAQKASQGTIINDTVYLFDMDSSPTVVRALDLAKGTFNDESHKPHPSVSQFGVTPWNNTILMSDDGDGSLSYFDTSNSSWLDTQALFRAAKPSHSSSVVFSSTSSLSSSSSSSSTRSSSMSHTSTMSTTSPTATSLPSKSSNSSSPDSATTSNNTNLKIILPSVLGSLAVLIGLCIILLVCLRKRRRRRQQPRLVIKRADSMNSKSNFFVREAGSKPGEELKTMDGNRNSGWSRYWSVEGSTHYPDMSSPDEKPNGLSWIAIPGRDGTSPDRPPTKGTRGYSACVEPYTDGEGDEAKRIWKAIDSNYTTPGPIGREGERSWMAM